MVSQILLQQFFNYLPLPLQWIIYDIRILKNTTMPETQCKIGDDYYKLTYNKRPTNNGTLYDGIKMLESGLEYELAVDESKDEIVSFNPPGTNPDIIAVIRDAIDESERNESISIIA